MLGTAQKPAASSPQSNPPSSESINARFASRRNWSTYHSRVTSEEQSSDIILRIELRGRAADEGTAVIGAMAADEPDTVEPARRDEVRREIGEKAPWPFDNGRDASVIDGTDDGAYPARSPRRESFVSS